MKREKTDRKTLKAFGVMLAAVAILSGATFAALQSQPAVLQSNTIETANADLQISTNGVTYGKNLSGYDFSGLIPGGKPRPLNGFPVYLKNVGSSQLSLGLID
jgi:hypothetical protein